MNKIKSHIFSNYKTAQTFLKTEKASLSLTNIKSPCEKKVAVFQHGLLASHEMFMCNEIKRNFVVNLLENGVSLWFPDSRGNTFSPAESYDFTIDTLVEDFKAVSEHIYKLEETPLQFVGHSLGCYLMVASASEEPSKFKEMYEDLVLIAPAVYFSHAEPLMKAASLLSSVIPFMDARMPDPPKLYDNLSLSKHKKIIEFTLDDTEARKNADDEALANFVQCVPCGTSVNVVSQMGQAHLNDSFGKFDYGYKKNCKLYGLSVPDYYNLRNIENDKFHIFSGETDRMCTKEDIDKLAGRLGERVKTREHVQNVGHNTFFIGKDSSWQDKAVSILANKI